MGGGGLGFSIKDNGVQVGRMVAVVIATVVTCRVRNPACTSCGSVRGRCMNGRSIKKCLHIPFGYKRRSKYRLNTQIHNIKFTLIDTTDWRFEGFGYHLISISQSKRENIVVAIIYRPPGNSLKSFNKEFSEFLSYAIEDNRKAIKIGNFNVNLLKIESNQSTNEFLNTLHSY